MLKKNFKKISLLVIGLSLLTSSVHASTDSEKKPMRMRIEERAISQDLQEEIDEQSRRDATDYEEDEYAVASHSSNYYPYDYSLKYLDSMGYKGSTFALSDGSIWIAKQSEGEKVQHWPDYYSHQEYGVDPAELYITTNNNWFFNKDYKFRLVNRNTGERVLVNLSQVPYTQCEIIIRNLFDTGHIELVDYLGNYVVMKISKSDRGIFEHWNLNDRIIIGRNTGWGSNRSPYLLINIDTAFTNVRASL